MRLCLEYIEDSRPFFIALLGERYGWCSPGPGSTDEDAVRMAQNIAKCLSKGRKNARRLLLIAKEQYFVLYQQLAHSAVDHIAANNIFQGHTGDKGTQGT